MCVTPTEPLGNSATELAFELDKICSMLFTILDTATDAHSRTFSADQLFLLEAVIVILSCLTVFHTSKVGV
jgi:hypothetical protein